MAQSEKAIAHGKPPAVHRPGLGARERRVRRAHGALVRWACVLGPGLITGAADDDPSGVATYAVAGASTGLGMLWTALFTLPMMASVQFIAAKIALVTGRGLVGALRGRYPGWAVSGAVLGLAVANTINAGADLGAAAAAINLLVPLPTFAVVVAIAAVLVVVQIWGSYRPFTTALKWMTLLLFAYVVATVLARPNWGEVLAATFVPHVRMDRTFLTVLVAVLGTTISPYMWFWQASQEVEERQAAGQHRLWQRRGASRTELKYAAYDIDAGMLVSNVVMYFIIAATAATLYRTGHTHIGSAAEAAQALRPIAGPYATWLFGVGLAAAGLIAIPVLTTSGAYAVAALWRRPAGLSERPHRAPLFYGVIALSTALGIVMNAVRINPIDALVVAAVINGFLTPPILVLLMLAANNPAILGKHVNGSLLNVIGWATAAIMTAAVIGLIVTLHP